MANEEIKKAIVDPDINKGRTATQIIVPKPSEVKPADNGGKKP